MSFLGVAPDERLFIALFEDDAWEDDISADVDAPWANVDDVLGYTSVADTDTRQAVVDSSCVTIFWAHLFLQVQIH